MSETKTTRSIVLLLLLLLIGSNVFWYFKFNSVSDEFRKEANLLNESDKLRNELVTELKAQKGDNMALNKTIDEKIMEIERKSRSIDSMIRAGQFTEKDLATVKSMLASLAREKDKYISQIQQLKNEVDSLRGETHSLQQNLATKQDEVNALRAENNFLFNKAQKAAMLQGGNFFASGVSFRRNGRENISTSVRSIDKIKICFDLLPNEVADPGNKQILIRIISPDGSTIYNETSYGSGKFKYGGFESLYTFSKSIAYTNDKISDCAYISTPATVFKGKYTVQYYCDGYKLGETFFVLE